MLQLFLPIKDSNRVGNSFYADFTNAYSTIILKILDIFHDRGRELPGKAKLSSAFVQA
jgi:hypothetical protein